MLPKVPRTVPNQQKTYDNHSLIKQNIGGSRPQRKNK